MSGFPVSDYPMLDFPTPSFPIPVPPRPAALAIKAAGAAVLRRDRLAAVVVVETGLALHELFKGPIAAGSEVHRPSPPFCVWAKRKAADFFKICGLAGEQKRALSCLTTPCFCLIIQLF